MQNSDQQEENFNVYLFSWSSLVHVSMGSRSTYSWFKVYGSRPTYSWFMKFGADSDQIFFR